MKNIILITLLLVLINSSGFTQKIKRDDDVTYVKTYVLTGDNGSALESIDDFKKNRKYSSIEKSLIFAILMEKNDTVVKYILLEKDNRTAYYSLSNEKSRKNFVKKYGAIYRVKRQTPVIN